MRFEVALHTFTFLALVLTASTQGQTVNNSTNTTDANTTETTTTSTTTTTSGLTTTTNRNPNPLINQICTQNGGTTDRVRLQALTSHNHRRSRLARGKVRKNNGRRLPKAANMMRLKYGCTLEQSARESARRCVNSPYPSLPANVRENIVKFRKSRAKTRVQAMKVAARHWWRQVRKRGSVGNRVTFRSHHQGRPISWFTLMAWANTRRVGCYVKSCNDGHWTVACHYYPGGNIVGATLYNQGRPCSQCPTGSFCNRRKLCAVP